MIFERMKKYELQEINDKRLKEMCGDAYENVMERGTKHAFCSKCTPKGKPVAISGLRIFINHKEDLIFSGNCKECRTDVVSYVS